MESSNDRRQGMSMNPSYGNNAHIKLNPSSGTGNSNNSSALNSDGDESADHLDTIDEDEENPKMQRVESVLDYVGDSDNDNDSENGHEGNNVNWQEEEEKITFSKPKNKTKNRLNYFGNLKLPVSFDKDKKSSKPKQIIPGGGNNDNANVCRELESSMMSFENFQGGQGGTIKPLKTWYRSLVIRQSCHSHMAEDMIAKDMYFNTISVAITAITSSAIFTSLVPSSPNSIEEAQTGGYNTLAILAGVLAAFNTVLQAIMKTMAYNRKGEQHLVAFKMFTRMRFKMENLIGDRKRYSHHEDIDDKMLSEWIEKYVELLESEPIIPQDILEEMSEKEDNAGLKWTRADDV